MTKIFCDIADINLIKKFDRKKIVKGFTTNPSLMRKAGAKNYELYCKNILKITNKPISFEVFADNEKGMIDQGLKISSWGKNVFVKVENKDNAYFKNLSKNVFEFHIAHNEGNYFCSEDELKSLEDNNQIAALYCSSEGKVDDKSNPNGAIKNIAGIFNEKKNILGMMPHPERMIDQSLSGEDGSIFFENLLKNLK